MRKLTALLLALTLLFTSACASGSPQDNPDPSNPAPSQEQVPPRQASQLRRSQNLNPNRSQSRNPHLWRKSRMKS